MPEISAPSLLDQNLTPENVFQEFMQKCIFNHQTEPKLLILLFISKKSHPVELYTYMEENAFFL